MCGGAEKEGNGLSGGVENNGSEVTREETDNKGEKMEENILSGGEENNGNEVMSEETEVSEEEREESKVAEEKGDSEMDENESEKCPSEHKSEDSDTILVLDDNDLHQRLLTEKCVIRHEGQMSLLPFYFLIFAM